MENNDTKNQIIEALGEYEGDDFLVTDELIEFIEDLEIKPAIPTPVSNEGEGEYLNYFDNKRQVFTGINAGEYLDKEDFETYGRWAESKFLKLQAQNKELREALQEILRFNSALLKGINSLQYPDNFAKAIDKAKELLNRINTK